MPPKHTQHLLKVSLTKVSHGDTTRWHDRHETIQQIMSKSSRFFFNSCCSRNRAQFILQWSWESVSPLLNIIKRSTQKDVIIIVNQKATYRRHISQAISNARKDNHTGQKTQALVAMHPYTFFSFWRVLCFQDGSVISKTTSKIISNCLLKSTSLINNTTQTQHSLTYPTQPIYSIRNKEGGEIVELVVTEDPAAKPAIDCKRKFLRLGLP